MNLHKKKSTMLPFVLSLPALSLPALSLSKGRSYVLSLTKGAGENRFCVSPKSAICNRKTFPGTFIIRRYTLKLE